MPVPKDDSNFYWLSLAWTSLEALHGDWGLDRYPWSLHLTLSFLPERMG